MVAFVRSGGRLYREVVAVRLSWRNVFLPDLCWFPPAEVGMPEATHAPLAPSWVCEVLGPRTADRDIGPKFAAYEEHGVREYWVLDPDSLDHRFFARENDYLTEFDAGQQWVAGRIWPGLALQRAWLDPRQLPNVDDSLAQAAAHGPGCEG